MGTDCIIIDGDYPYSTGEPFLENEISFLSEAFDRVFVFSYNAKENECMTRSLPVNVESNPVGIIQSKLRFLFYPLVGLFPSEISIVPFNGTKQYVLALYQRGRSAAAFHKILHKLNNINLGSNVVVYSYWLTDHALTALRIRHYLQDRGTKAIVVCRAHGFDLYKERNSIGCWPYQETIIKEMDYVCPCSEAGSKYLRASYPKMADKVLTFRLGTFDYGLKKTDNNFKNKVLLTCSSLKPLKRTALFARAFSKLCIKRDDCYWVCIGDGEEYDAILEIIKENKIQGKVKMLGRLSNTEVIEYYRNHSITYFCNVSTTEGLPVSIMEAMSFGIPCIATDVGGTSELVNSNNGFLIPSEFNVDELEDWIEKALNISDDNYQMLCRNARSTWNQDVNAEENYKKWCSFLKERLR